MRPLFTSRSEWLAAAQIGERAYIRQALGYLLRGGFLGFVTLVGPIGAHDPYWRSLPVLWVFCLSLLGATSLSALLFRREWRTAFRYYSMQPISTPPPKA